MLLKKIVQIVVLLMLTVNFCIAQNNILNTKVDINTSDKTLKQILSEIEKQNGIRFSYSDNLLPKTLFNKIESQPTLKQFLNNLLHPINIDYKIVKEQIVLFESAREIEYFNLSGFVRDQKNSENIINGAVYANDVGIGTITNTYGYFLIKLPEGFHKIKFYSLGYELIDTMIDVRSDTHISINLKPKSFQMQEIIIRNNIESDFMESAISNIAKMTIGKLKEMPNILGEHDALRNLDMMPGMQISEFSTSSIYTRGGTSDQTTFLMDDAEVFTASHFSGASIFNPDIINHIDIYKNELPTIQSGALSSVIDVRLRDGDMQQWHTSGSIGLLTARALIEGPIKKNKSSVLLAVRRTYADRVLEPILKHYNVKLKFYFYDINLKLNHIFNDKNRIYFSLYSGADKIDHYMFMEHHNYIYNLRYNHIFGNHLFSNLTLSIGLDKTDLSNFYFKGNMKWTSLSRNANVKLNFSHIVNRHINLKYGIQSTLHNIEPFDLELNTNGEIRVFESRINAQSVIQSGIYVDQTYNIGARLTLLAGARLNYYRAPSNQLQHNVDSSFYYAEWNATANYRATDKILLKINASQKQKTIHQLQVSAYGITINRWLPTNSNFLPERSFNTSLSAYCEPADWLNFSTSVYFRKMSNMIETMQEMRLIYEMNPEHFLHHTSSHANGCELTCNATFSKLHIAVSYDYTNSHWKTNGLNNNKSYPASFIRKHSFIINGRYNINERMQLSSSWQIASGIPYTAAIGKYVIDNKTVLQFNENRINTKKLPSYHRLDISLDIEGKNNQTKRWKSYWNFAIYNVYAHKNPLGVSYFISDDNGKERLNPGFYYFYQFVPSISYRFVF